MRRNSSQKTSLWSWALGILLPSLPSPRFGVDVLRLLLILALDLAIGSTIFPHHLMDLTTAWLSFLFISRPPLRALLLLILAAVTLEEHGALPAGIYGCSYLIALTVISILRKQIAWRNYFPWLVTTALVQGWIICFELFVFYLKDSSFFAYNISYLLGQSLRLGSAAVLATIFYLSNSKAIGEDQTFGITS